VIIAIFFVKLFGFGPVAGLLTLAFASAIFLGKMIAEDIENVRIGPVEAVRATGANAFQVFCYAVWPQVKVAWTGIGIYTWDVAFRAATVVGFFGAGGMGWYLRRTIEGLETERTAAIILTILALVMASEALSAWARARVMNR
jgi:phosphonate transport system permease protein